MPFVSPTARRRILITGETGAGKTRCIRTFPGPKMVLVCPGEFGQDTLLKTDGTPLDDDTKVIVWESDPEKPQTSTAIIDEFRKMLFGIVRGKEGPVHTLAIDGIHKLYEYMMDAKSGGEYFAGSPFKTESRNDSQVVDPRVSAQAEHLLMDTLSIVHLSRIPIVLVTIWDKGTGIRKAKVQADGSKEKWQDIPQHNMPALYSAASRKILGQFGVCLYAKAETKKVEKEVNGRKAWVSERQFVWQTQPDNEVGACAVKADDGKVIDIPKFVRADWRELAKYLEQG